MPKLRYNILKFEPGVWEHTPNGDNVRVNRYRINVWGLVQMIVIVQPYDPKEAVQKQLHREELEPLLINILKDAGFNQKANANPE